MTRIGETVAAAKKKKNQEERRNLDSICDRGPDMTESRAEIATAASVCGAFKSSR